MNYKRTGIIFVCLLSCILVGCSMKLGRAAYTENIHQDFPGVIKKGDKIYYRYKPTVDGKLKELDETTKKERIIEEEYTWDFAVTEDKVYYIIEEDEGFQLVEKNLKTGEGKNIASDVDHSCLIVTQNEVIFYSVTNNEIIGMNLQTDEKRVLKTIDESNIVSTMAEYGGQLYLVEYRVETRPMQLSYYRIDLETGDIYDWIPFCEIIGVSESGETLYFYSRDEKFRTDFSYYFENCIYRIKKDGTGKQELYKWEWENEFCGYIRCVDEWIVYKDWRDDKAYKMNQFGKEKTQLPIEREIQMFTTWEDKIYYTDREGHLYENDLSGKNELRLY